jgi:hypothetical protein
MDEEKRLALVERLEPFIEDQDCYSPAPLVTLELFFDGNDDEGSIGCNLMEHPGVQTFYQSLAKLRDRAGVTGLWVIAKQHDWKPGWPFSDEVLIRTTLPDSEIKKALEHLSPDEVGEADSIEQSHDSDGNPASCANTEKHIVVWWD